MTLRARMVAYAREQFTARLIARRISDGTTSLLTIERVFTLA